MAPAPVLGSRPSFSWGRFVVEALVGGAIGSGLALGTYYGICGDEACAGGAFAGMGANLVVTPLAVYGLGAVMGGRGSLRTAYYGSLVGFGAGGATYVASPLAALSVGMFLMPFGAAFGYEASSVTNLAEMSAAPQVSWHPTFGPVLGRSGFAGASAGLAGAF